MNEKPSFKIHRRPELQSSSLVVCWSEDAGKLGSKVVEYLKTKLVGKEFAEIEPESFFPLGGVSVEDDVAQFPQSKFYSCEGKNLVIFGSNPPITDWYKFLNSVLDVAEYYCQAKELYTIGGMVSLSAHTAPRQLIAVANSPEMKRTLSKYDLIKEMDFETPPGQRPTLSSFLLWVAKRRNMAGASLWVPVPFYLVATEDPQANRKVIDFFNKRFGIGIDLKQLDEEVAKQNEKIAQARAQSPEIDDYIRKLESNIGLTAEENEKLVKEMEELLRKRV